MSDLVISINATMTNGATFVRGRLKNASGAQVDELDVGVINGHLESDFEFREPGAGGYTIECDVYGGNGQLLQANAFKAGPFHVDASGSYMTVALAAAS